MRGEDVGPGSSFAATVVPLRILYVFNSLVLSDGFRLVSKFALAGVSSTLVVAGLYGRLKLDPDEIDF